MPAHSSIRHWRATAPFPYRIAMAVPRGNRDSVRGSRPQSASGRPQAARPELAEPEDVADPLAPRHVIDYTLSRRHDLAALVLTATGASDHLDPHPNLARAAKNHGVPAGEDCPWCKDSTALKTLNFVYGDELGPFAGRIRTQNELGEMAHKHGRFRVYVVEICTSCGWNHLTRSYVLGDGVPRPALRAPRDFLD